MTHVFCKKPKVFYILNRLQRSIGAYFAIREAVKEFNKEISPRFDAPFTPEKVLMNLYSGRF